MPKNILKNVTHICHDWDGVYTHYTDHDAFWKMTGKLAVEAKIFTNEQEAEKIIRDIYLIILLMIFFTKNMVFH